MANAGTTMGPLPNMVEDFTINLHKNLANKIQGNFVNSALSAHIVLSMATFGACNITAQEMRSVLRLSQNDEENYQGFHNFIYTLDNVPNVILKLANKIYGSKILQIKDSFKKVTNTYFVSESETLDFSKAESIKIVNKWCNDKTNGKIPEMFKDGELNAGTMMVLLNAVYFKGHWKTKFNKIETKLAPFYINEKTTLNVPMMRIVKKFIYKDFIEFEAEYIALPYENEDVVMIIVVPKKVDGLKNLEKNLEKIFNYEKSFKPYKPKIALTLPKFKVETTIDLIPHLKEMGMINMFTNQANFSRISDNPLKIDMVRQKAIIEIDEEGTEAAAITGITIRKMSMPLPPLSVNVNRPFFYKIIYKNITLFSGQIINPVETKKLETSQEHSKYRNRPVLIRGTLSILP